MDLGRESFRHKILRRTRRLVPPSDFRAVRERLRDCRGIEIGGPSAVFRRWNLWPIYPVVRALDNYDFAARTIWSEPQPELNVITGMRAPAGLLIGEASVMEGVVSARYECLLASHVLEHIANPLKALHTWRRVVKRGGTIVLVVPHRDGTFDHHRPVTSLDHIL